MYPTVTSTNNTPPLRDTSVLRGDPGNARVVDHAQRRAVSLAVAPETPSAVVRLSDVKEKEVTYTERGALHKPVSIEDESKSPDLVSSVDAFLDAAKDAFVALKDSAVAVKDATVAVGSATVKGLVVVKDAAVAGWDYATAAGNQQIEITPKDTLI